MSESRAELPLSSDVRRGLYGGQVSSKTRVPVRPSTGEEIGGPPKKPVTFRTVLRDAGDLVKARKGRLALGLFVMAVSRLCGLVLPYTTKFLIDDVIGKGRLELLNLLVGVAAGAVVLQAASGFALSQILGKTAQRSITEMRRRLQRHVSHLRVAYFEQTKAGALLSRVVNDAEGLRNLVGSGLVELVGGLVTAVFALGLLLHLNAKLTLIALSVMSLFGFVMHYSFKTLRPLFRERSKISADLSGRLTESFSGVRVVKAYGAERRESLIFAKAAHRMFRNVARTITSFSAIGAASSLVLGGISVTIMAVAARLIVAKEMSLGDFFAFSLYLGMLVGPIVQVVNIGSQLNEAFAGLERIRELLNEPVEDADDDKRQPLGEVEGRIEVRDVHFEYQEGAPVLNGISFVAEPGTVTALVGPSGAGKSTVIGLVAGFYRPTSGSIWVDGENLANVRLRDYRAQLGVVFQDNFLFDGTVLENIAYARPEASREEILHAARVARCEDFAMKLPQGYDTIVGERGVKLSGGERQRVAIARAILADPRILILDEATSSLDSESEALIQEGLAELMRGRTTFVIAHRLSTIRRADTILVIVDGRVEERGRHEELLAHGGRYHALYTRQYNLESNLFRNPGEKVEEEEVKLIPRAQADAGAVGKLPLIPV